MEDNLEKEETPKEEKEELLAKLIEWYENSELSTQVSRVLCERDRDYYDHKQLSAEEIAVLNERGQPPIVINRIKPKVDFLLGMERQMRSDPKAYPRTPQHEESSNSATDSLRYVMDNNAFNYIRSDVCENMLIEGTGGAEVLMKQTSKGMEVEIKRYPWDRLFWDPHSRSRSFDDAKYKGAVIWMDLEDALDMVKGKEEKANLKAALSADVGVSQYDTYDDTPRVQWIDKSRERIKMCTIWYKDEGKWNWAMFTAGGFVQGPMISPFKDEDGEPECKLEMQSSHVDREGYRYGVVRGLIDVQDEINKRRSKALHLLTMRQTLSEKGAVEDLDLAKSQLSKPDGHIEITPGMRFEVLPTGDMTAGHLALLQEAKEEIDSIGANAALQGKEERVMSGRALMARQQSGQMELGPVFDSLRSWEKRIYRSTWNSIRQFWNEERWIRVTDDERNLKWVGLNRPITLREQMEKEVGPAPEEFANDPRLEMPVGKENDIAELDVDIIIEDAPDTITLQTEQFDMLVQMYQANPDAVPFDLVIEASQLRNKNELLERIKGGATKEEQQQSEQARQQAQQEVMDLQKRGEEAKIAKDQSDAMKTAAEAKAIKAGIERGPPAPLPPDTTATDLKRYEIDTNAARDIRVKELELEAARYNYMAAESSRPVEKEEKEEKEIPGEINVIVGGSKRITIDRSNGEITGATVESE